jgi:integrase
MLRMKGRSESTIASYTWLAEKYIEPEIGMIPLTKLTQVNLNDFMQRKIEAGLSPRTVGYCHAVVRSALSRAEKDGLVARNVAKLATPPAQTGGPKIEPLTPQETRLFLAAVAGHRLEAVYSVALALGLRRGEALGLEWPAVDLEAGVLSVTQTVKRVKGKGLLIERIAKTPKSLRMLPLPAFAIRALIAHKEQQAQEREFAGDEWREHGLVFTSTVGTPIEPRNLVRHFHATLKAIKIDRRRFHDLRHTVASLLIAQGATLHEVKDILGHSQIRLTADLYGHIYMDAKREVISRMDDVLGPQTGRVAPSVAPSGPKARLN